MARRVPPTSSRSRRHPPSARRRLLLHRWRSWWTRSPRTPGRRPPPRGGVSRPRHPVRPDGPPSATERDCGHLPQYPEELHEVHAPDGRGDAFERLRDVAQPAASAVADVAVAAGARRVLQGGFGTVALAGALPRGILLRLQHGGRRARRGIRRREGALHLAHDPLREREVLYPASRAAGRTSAKSLTGPEGAGSWNAASSTTVPGTRRRKVLVMGGCPGTGEWAGGAVARWLSSREQPLPTRGGDCG